MSDFFLMICHIPIQIELRGTSKSDALPLSQFFVYLTVL